MDTPRCEKHDRDMMEIRMPERFGGLIPASTSFACLDCMIENPGDKAPDGNRNY